jgi:toxin ParE1/3/4
MRLEWSAYALADLKAISEYIEHNRSLEAANRVTQYIYDAIQDLTVMPNRGRPGRIAGTRELPILQSPYLVVYRVQSERLFVLNIIHGALPWP